ncbi:NADH:ubiquinone reductase (Na(+)-transporting) subunit D [Flavobacteriales bacterium]|jgi:Na+-transporting NADH:ubiquinone oxidoreductase subunit D|nr:NADH:ubiquinone reductase (Na(+)-transporting) subunit D [Flavobacteriales bacterium]MDA8934644.1 NADH:ubiquinone reductase (Na(+)-transporting) subunit D [Flavobacteriales bacterium]MDG1146148.1 NADH:ubiquinone reductase (Na(+)-transporting) subunit D [Flavobacteriales bacterium]MDG1396514.1 NADH:ubiquinone reductase (Na(+)-transporting) subunit D [Flavobacteriales bacterium]|tara:strand:+ start:14126 stop:14773 length:648 start_codon:yes stop_codon:yes gene_type:complete
MSEKKEELFSKKNRKLMTDPLDGSNPISVQVLGICSALAITVQVEQAFVMSAAVMAVMVFGNIIVSAMRNLIPSRIRIIVQLVIVAALVILVNELLKAFMPDVSEKLSVFVGLIITNCIIMGRLEAFALGNKVWPSFLDAIGNSIGYAWILVVVAFFRELFGSGKILGFQIIPESFYEAGYMNNNMMILPPMALITVALIIWVQRSKNTDLIEEN